MSDIYLLNRFQIINIFKNNNKQYIIEMSDQEDNFEVGNAGSSFTVPTQAGSIKKGGYCMLKGHPCKVIQYSTAKPGKHGSAKATIVGVDIFTNKKYQDGGPTASNMEVPIVKKTELEILDVNNQGFCSLVKENGQLKQDLKLPIGEDDAELCADIKKHLAEGNQTFVTIIEACGQEKIVSVRTK